MKKIVICLLTLMLVCSLAACGGSKHDKFFVEDGASYTYRLALNSLPTSWNNHTYQSNDGTYVLDYAEDSLYVFDYNETKDGYKIVPSMANGMPKDVTKDYVGKFGITEESENQVYEISLKDWLKFDNGDAITANDFIKSAQLLMNPAAANYRADNFYNGQMKVYGAENYVKQGTYALSEFVSADYGDDEYVLPADMTTNEAGILQVNGQDVVVDLSSGGNWGSNGITDYYDYGYINAQKAAYDKLVAAADSLNRVKLTSELLTAVQDIIAELHGCANVDEYVKDAGDYAYTEFEEMAFLGADWPEYSWDEVGYFAKDDHTLVLVLTNPLSGFYLNYSLSSNLNLVHTATYEACTSNDGGVYSNSYGTSVETYVGYGPYKLTSFIDSSELKFERNEFWHGYYEEEHKGQYATTNISFKQVSEEATRLEMFLKGEIDSYGLQAKDMDDYQGSDFTYYTEGDSTWFITFNPNETALATAETNAKANTPGNTVVKRILCIKDFRKALSFSVDRAAYELALDPTGSPALALYGNMIISDPDTGTAYRTTDEAKKVIVDFWGLGDEVGAGKEYATYDDAIASITGYDLAGAKELFNSAYDQAVAAGYIPADTDKWEIQIIIGQPGSGSSAYYNNGYELLKKVWTEAVEGTKLEGHMVFTQSQPLGSSNFSSYLKNNTVDLLFGVGWTGSALDPYSLFQVYVDASYQYDPAWDTTQTLVTVELDGKALTTDAYSWYLAMSGETIDTKDANGEVVSVTAGTTAPNATRLAILSALEGVVLQQYNTIPVGLDASAALKGMRIKYYTEEYVYGVGRGGVQYFTYAMNDDEWASYVKEQGGTLDYK